MVTEEHMTSVQITKQAFSVGGPLNRTNRDLILLDTFCIFRAKDCVSKPCCSNWVSQVFLWRFNRELGFRVMAKAAEEGKIADTNIPQENQVEV